MFRWRHLLLAERAGRSDDDRLARVDAQGVEVLHRGDGEAAVVAVADAFELNLLPSLQTLLDEDLRGEGEGALCQLAESLLVGADARAQAAQGVGRADHDGEADLAGSLQGVVHRLNGMADGGLQRDLVQLADEEVAVLSVHDGLHARAQHAHAILLQRAVLPQLRAAVQGRLAAEGEQDAVGALLLDDLRDEVGGDRLEVHCVGDAFRSLNCSDVGVDEHATDAFLTQGLQSLRARIVKLTCLSDLQGAAAQHEHLCQLFVVHCFLP